MNENVFEEIHKYKCINLLKKGQRRMAMRSFYILEITKPCLPVAMLNQTFGVLMSKEVTLGI